MDIKQEQKRNLTYSILKIEYDSWINNYFNGRDENDLRFGQYIHNNFVLSSRNGGIDRTYLYYTENTTEAYNSILKILNQNNE